MIRCSQSYTYTSGEHTQKGGVIGCVEAPKVRKERGKKTPYQKVENVGAKGICRILDL